MKNKLMIAGAVYIALLVVTIPVIAVYFIVNSKEPGTTQAIQTPKAEDDKLDSEITGAKDIFVDGCSQSGTSISDCGCMFEHIDRNVTNARFNEMMYEATETSDIKEINDAATYCTSDSI